MHHVLILVHDLGSRKRKLLECITRTVVVLLFCVLVLIFEHRRSCSTLDDMCSAMFGASLAGFQG
jgi:hypothetical protein